MKVNKEQIFRELYKNHVFRDAYLDKLPDEFQVAIMDNEYTHAMWKDHYAMFDVIFGEHRESIMWFLYEWQPGYEVGYGEMTEAINDIDQYIDWMQRMEGFDRG